MKYGIISDTHWEFYIKEAQEAITQRIYDARDDYDRLLIAGDIHSDDEARETWLSGLDFAGIKYDFVMGNHDYYGGPFWEQFDDRDGVVQTPLYTNFGNDPFCARHAARCITDFRATADLIPYDYIKSYNNVVDKIFESESEVVMTHWAPTMKAVAPQFEGDVLNPYFCNNLDERIMDSNKKLWVFGHVHTRWDFMIGDCRMVSNPLGYPREISGSYNIKIIEV